MQTECSGTQREFQGLGRRRVVAAFDGGHISSDGGVPLLREVDERLELCERFSACFTDRRDRDPIAHTAPESVRRRVYGLAVGYEDLNAPDDLRGGPLGGDGGGQDGPGRPGTPAGAGRRLRPGLTRASSPGPIQASRATTS